MVLGIPKKTYLNQFFSFWLFQFPLAFFTVISLQWGLLVYYWISSYQKFYLPYYASIFFAKGNGNKQRYKQTTIF